MISEKWGVPIDVVRKKYNAADFNEIAPFSISGLHSRLEYKEFKRNVTRQSWFTKDYKLCAIIDSFLSDKAFLQCKTPKERAEFISHRFGLASPDSLEMMLKDAELLEKYISTKYGKPTKRTWSKSSGLTYWSTKETLVVMGLTPERNLGIQFYSYEFMPYCGDLETVKAFEGLRQAFLYE